LFTIYETDLGLFFYLKTLPSAKRLQFQCPHRLAAILFVYIKLPFNVTDTVFVTT